MSTRSLEQEHTNFTDVAAAPATSHSTLRKRIQYTLGWPQVQIELTPDQIDEQIIYSLKWYKKHATGTATKRQFLTFELVYGQQYYTLPIEVRDVVDYSLDTSLTGINTLFTLENYLWNYGFLNFLDFQSGQFTLLSYHLVLDYIETLRRYVSGKYKFTWNEWTHQIQVEPEPDGTEIAMIECIVDVGDDYLKDAIWIEDYATARCKYIIGEMRSKYEGVQLPGSGGSLNGSTMKQEAIERMRDLEERLLKEDAEGWGIFIG